MTKRQYKLKQRAAQQRETRERIVDAAMALHEELGPASTTISALAERAGVQRLTVYRHFADDREILQACSAKWMSQHPPPDISKIRQSDPAERIRALLQAIYSYYEDTQGMWRSLYRDVGQIDALDEPMRQFEDYLATVAEALMAACGSGRSKRLRAAIAHAIRFSTWQSLSEQGLGARATATLVCEWILATNRKRPGA